MYAYSTEIYDTAIKNTGMRVLSVCGRLGIIVMGVIGMSALDWADGMGLYIIFIWMSLVGGMAVSQCDECEI